MTLILSYDGAMTPTRADTLRASVTATMLDGRYPAERYTRLFVMVDNDRIHQVKAVEDWLAAHPR
jgi:hypothetical protein